MIISCSFLVGMRNVSAESNGENQNTILCSITFSQKLCHVGYLAQQTHTHHIQYLLLSNSNNCYMNTPQCYVYRYSDCLVIHQLVEILASKHIIKLKKVQKGHDNSTQTPKFRVMWKTYEGWNFNSGNYLFTTDTKQIHVSKFYCPSMQSPALCTTRSQGCGNRRIPLAAPVVLIVRMEQSTA